MKYHYIIPTGQRDRISRSLAGRKLVSVGKTYLLKVSLLDSRIMYVLWLSYTALSKTVSLWPSFINQGLLNRWFYIFRIFKKQDLEMPDAINNVSLLMQRH